MAAFQETTNSFQAIGAVMTGERSTVTLEEATALKPPKSLIPMNRHWSSGPAPAASAQWTGAPIINRRMGRCLSCKVWRAHKGLEFFEQFLRQAAGFLVGAGADVPCFPFGQQSAARIEDAEAEA